MNQLRGTKEVRYVSDIRRIEVVVSKDMPDADVIEGYNLGDIDGREIDRRIEIEER